MISNARFMMPPLPPLPPPPSVSTVEGGSGATGSINVAPLSTVPLVNGSSGHFVQMPNLRTCALRITLPMNLVTPGADELLAHLLVEGSDATKQTLARLRDQGIQFGIVKMDNQIMIVANARAEQAGSMVQTVLNLLRNPVIDPASFDTVKGTLLRQLQGRLSDPDLQLADAISQRIYGVGHDLSLTPRERMHITATQTLPGLLGQYRHTLQQTNAMQMLLMMPQPATIQQQVLNEAIQRTGWFRDPYAPLTTGGEYALPNPQGDQRPVLLPNESLKRALVQVTWKAPDIRDPDYPAYLLLKELLEGVSQGSFFQTMRTDHGLVYRVLQSEGSRLAQGRRYDVSVEVDFNQIGQALSDIGYVTRTLCNNQLTPDKIESLKRKHLLTQRNMDQTADGASSFYEPWLRMGLPAPSPAQLQAVLNQVDPAALQRVANRMFNPAVGFRIVGVSAPRAVLQQAFPGQPV